MEDDLSHLNLFLLEDQICDGLVVRQFHQKGLDESQHCGYHLFFCEVDTAFDDSLGDVLGNFSFLFEPEVFDQTRVFVHGQDDVGHCLERSSQKLGDVHLAVLIDAGLVACTVVRGVSQYLVDVFVLVGITFESELQEGSVEVKSVFHLTGFTVLHKLLDVSREEFVDAETALDVVDHVA